MSCFDIEGCRRSRRQPRQYSGLQNPVSVGARETDPPSPVRSEPEGARTLPENFRDLSLRASGWISLTTLSFYRSTRHIAPPMEKWRSSSTPTISRPSDSRRHQAGGFWIGGYHQF
jgi:hypothetical protein